MKNEGSVAMLGMVENRMVVDSQWYWNMPAEIRDKLESPGCREIRTGVFVPEDDAFNYALEHCLKAVPSGIYEIEWTQEFKEMLVEWFYSGNWIKEG